MSKPEIITDFDLERYKITILSLTDFSKHLMLILVAAIAFSASMVSSTTSELSQYTFIVSVIFSILSFMAGHESYILKINSLLKEDVNYNFTKESDVINSTLITKTKRYVEWQYLFTLASLILICISIGFTAFDSSNNNINCSNAHENIY